MIDYEKEVTKYGHSLTEKNKEKTREVFDELLTCGFTFEWLYYAIQHLNGRTVIQNPNLMFYRPFQEEVNEIMENGRKQERQRKARNAEICAKIEKQILLRQEKEKNIKIIFQSPKPKQVKQIDLAAIADMEDDVDGANPKN